MKLCAPVFPSFFEKYLACRPLYQFVGPSHLMMPRFICSVEGCHFVIGASAASLDKAVRASTVLRNMADSFLGLTRALISLTKEEIFNIGGFVVVLKPGQVLQVPGGYIVAQTGFSPESSITHWISSRGTAGDLNFGDHIDLVLRLLENDMKALKDAPADKERFGYVQNLYKQLSAAPLFLKWAQDRLRYFDKSEIGGHVMLKKANKVDNLEHFVDYLQNMTGFADLAHDSVVCLFTNFTIVLVLR